MMNWMRAEPLQVTVQRLARYGYKSIELTGDPDRQDVGEIRRILREANVRCSGVLAVIPPGMGLISTDEARRASAVDYAKRCISIAAALGGSELTVVPASVWKLEPDASPDDEWLWAVESLTEVHAHAAKLGVRVAIEAINRYETYFVNRADQALALAEAVGGDCGVCLDTFHLNIEEPDPLQAIRACGYRLAAFHIADSNRLACGMGHFDWPLIVQTLEEVGYGGVLSLECYPQLDRTPANPFPDALEPAAALTTRAERPESEPLRGSLVTEAFYDRLVETTAATLLPLIENSGGPAG